MYNQNDNLFLTHWPIKSTEIKPMYVLIYTKYLMGIYKLHNLIINPNKKYRIIVLNFLFIKGTNSSYRL